MKTPRSESDLRWEKLLREAQSDVGPPVDVSALLRAVRDVALAKRRGWAEEFLMLFSSGRVVASCLAGVSAATLITTWQIWEWWQALPWVQLLANSIGGVT